jgi:hypothetical protein
MVETDKIVAQMLDTAEENKVFTHYLDRDNKTKRCVQIIQPVVELYETIVGKKKLMQVIVNTESGKIQGITIEKHKKENDKWIREQKINFSVFCTKDLVDFLDFMKNISLEDLNGKKFKYLDDATLQTSYDLQKLSQIFSNDLERQQRFLESLTPENIENINHLSSIKKLENTITKWEELIKLAQDEKKWQDFFMENSWILSQIFATPITIIDREFYVGGKSQGKNRAGKFTDFALENSITQNIAIIEIKTPKTRLIQEKPYRGADVFAIDNELAGAISQILNQKDTLQKDYKFDNANKKYKVHDPKCVLIIGHHENLDEQQKTCFELFRRNQKNIEIICFDELLLKVKELLKILKNQD